MADFSSEDLTGARFEDVRLNGARFHDVDLSGASFRLVDLTGVGIRGAAVVDVEINGEVENLRVNGVDVGRFVEAELIRRHPEWARLRPASAAGYREIWPVLEGLWEETVARARSLPPDWLHQRVDGEWSFIETLRHLVFATDAWVRRALLGNPSPWDPLDLPHDEMPDRPGVVPRDRAARPTLDEVLALRSDRMATVGQVIAGLTDEQLAGSTEPVLAPGLPGTGELPGQPVSAVHPRRRMASPLVRGARPRRTSALAGRPVVGSVLGVRVLQAAPVPGRRGNAVQHEPGRRPHQDQFRPRAAPAVHEPED